MHTIASIEKSVSISGEDWFKSVIYADGPITSHLPSLKDIARANEKFTTQQWSDYRAAEDALIADITKKYPDFFDNFKAAMESKDPEKIINAIENSKSIVYETLKVQLAKEGYDLDQETKNYMDAHGMQMQPNSLALIIVITIVVVLTVAINLTYEVNKTWSKDNPPPTTGTGSLSAEMLAAEIAKL